MTSVAPVSQEAGLEVLRSRIDPNSGPKRMLALDGGGVRGILTLQFLRRIESILRQRRQDSKLVLADYFDLIGGTSTGAIIAAGLALGFNVDKIELLYRDLAGRIFAKPLFRIGAIVPKFGRAKLIAALQDAYGASTTIGSSDLRTGLMIMTKRMDTGSPWPLTNHPDDPYYSPVVGKKRVGNANMLLWQVVRASTAAPHYFRPEELEVGQTRDPQTGKTMVEVGQFVDGGVSTANNPSLQLLKVALLKGFAFRWKPGEHNLLLISVGTGLRDRRRGKASGFGATAGAFAARAILSIMDDCNTEVETVMQWLSRTSTARRIDGQIGTLGNDQLATMPLFTYQRYNVSFEELWLKQSLGLSMSQTELRALELMDCPANMDWLAQLGKAAADALVAENHFPASFDVQ
jgi:uncharacterized protein